MFNVEQFAFKAFGFEESVLANSIIIYLPVIEYVRFTENDTPEPALHKEIIERNPLSVITCNKYFIFCKSITDIIIPDPEQRFAECTSQLLIIPHPIRLNSNDPDIKLRQLLVEIPLFIYHKLLNLFRFC